MKSIIIHDKFECSFISDDGIDGASYIVNIYIKNIISNHHIENIKKIIDNFDHAAVVNNINTDIIDISKRIIQVNQKVYEYIIAQSLFNLLDLYTTKNNILLNKLSCINPGKITYEIYNIDPELIINIKN